MFLSDRFIYLELQKTASTHIVKLLKKVVGGKEFGKHNRVTPELLNGGRLILGSVRNPWDWYVSLWAYGCDTQKGLFRQLTRPRTPLRMLCTRDVKSGLRQCIQEARKPVNRWRKTYADSRDTLQFRRWLRMTLDPKNSPYLGEGYDASGMSSVAGLLTYRYLGLFSEPTRSFRSCVFLSTDDLERFDRRFNMTHFIIRTEFLEEDFIEAMKLCGIDLTERHLDVIRSAKRTNASTRRRSIESYYDEETADLVAVREEFIVRTFNYSKPRCRPDTGEGK